MDPKKELSHKPYRTHVSKGCLYPTSLGMWSHSSSSSSSIVNLNVYSKVIFYLDLVWYMLGSIWSPDLYFVTWPHQHIDFICSSWAARTVQCSKIFLVFSFIDFLNLMCSHMTFLTNKGGLFIILCRSFPYCDRRHSKSSFYPYLLLTDWLT